VEQLNWKRLIVGGLLAGVIIDAFEWLINGLIFANDWKAAMAALNLTMTFSVKQMVTLNLWGFVTGIALVWLYASIRPRYGAGPKTAIVAGVAMWFMNYVLGGMFPALMHIYPRPLAAMTTALAIVEVLVAALVGAAVYQEKAQPQARSAAA
jgi:hypothetical protein